LNPDTITLAAVGDISLSHTYDALLRSKGPHFPFQAVRPLFDGKDLVCCNLEGPLSLKGSPYPLKCSLRGHPHYIQGLAQAGFNYCSLANNHILDYQDEALWETLDLLTQHGIGYSGVGANLDEAVNPFLFQAQGIRVALFSFCDVEIDSPFYATLEQRGIAPLDLDLAGSAFHVVQEEVDLLFVSLHWGIEHFRYPSPDQIRKGHALVDMGAHLILGHHPHVIQGMETYKNALICYSLGNFLFSDILWDWTTESGETRHTRVPLRRKHRESLVLEARFSRDGLLSYATHSAYLTRSLQVVPRTDTGGKRKLNRLSQPIGLPGYPNYYARAQRRAFFRKKGSYLLGRAARFYRLRPRHLRKLIEAVRPKGPGL